MSTAMEHPSIKQFRQALQASAVTPDKEKQFDKWRNGPKCNGELKEAADALWANYQQQGKRASAGVQQYYQPAAIQAKGSWRDNRGGNARGAGLRPMPQQPQAALNANAAEPELIGGAFHNPYTFLPFPAKAPIRRFPTPFSIDEVETDRFTGFLDLEIKLLSPLLTNSPDPINPKADHKEYRALTIGSDVVVPATGIKGSLRTLMTILNGGTLGYVDEEAWLCQGRDKNLGPAGKQSPAETPKHAFLARVVEPGGFDRKGKIEIGHTTLMKADELETLAQRSGMGKLPRPRAHCKVDYLWINDDQSSLSRQRDDRHPWQIKLSGRPIMNKGKREGLFLGNGPVIELDSGLWAAYSGRNRHGDHPELRKGDLVWLEPKSPDLQEITKAEHIKSLQWARWGREGEGLLDVVSREHADILPDAFNPDGMVDEVTDLFGQIPRPEMCEHIEKFRKWKELKQPGPAPKFAARVRTSNLVFVSAAGLTHQETLAPLAPPHPGCAAFYRQPLGPLGQAADKVCNHNMSLRGFKVYRTSAERGQDTPWKYANQGVYGETGRISKPDQRVNKTVSLLMEDKAPIGRLRISLRAMTKRELALVLSACAVDWRVGGGKPLGLGHCRVQKATLREFKDDGSLGAAVEVTRPASEPATLPAVFATEQDAQLLSRMQLWQASQEPVAKLRYPRAVDENQHGKSRGGHVWFQRHAQPSKTGGDEPYATGLQVMHLGGSLATDSGKNAMRAQPLPEFDPTAPQSDVLYGYDMIVRDDQDWREQARNRSTLVKRIESFDEAEHSRGGDHSSGNTSQNRENRQHGRQDR